MLTRLPGRFAVCRLSPDAAVPAWARGPFVSMTHTTDELSVICAADAVPESVQVESGWHCLKVEGPFDLAGTVGVLAELSGALAAANISVLAVGTYDTDYLLVQEGRMEAAVKALQSRGHTVVG